MTFLKFPQMTMQIAGAKLNPPFENGQSLTVDIVWSCWFFFLLKRANKLCAIIIIDKWNGVW